MGVYTRILKTWRAQKDTGISSLFIRLLFLAVLMWAILLGITLYVTVQFSLSTLQTEIEGHLVSTSSSLAESDWVRQALLDGYCSDGLIRYLDTLTSQASDFEIITIAGTDSIRLYHVDHSRIGQTFVGGDQGPVLEGESYLSNAVGTLGLQRRAFTPVRDADGMVIGFVVVSTTMDRLQIPRNHIFQIYAQLALALALATLLFVGALTLYIRHLLHGFGPEELFHNYLTQNEILNNLDQGIISVDESGTVQLVNQVAEEMLGQRAVFLQGNPLDDLIREEGGGSLLAAPKKNVPTSRPNILADCIPLEKEQKRVGTTLILTDRSGAVRTAEQLTGTRHIISTLRANSHEFMNKLQVISGLLQMGRSEDVLTYIGDISAVQSKSIAPVLQHIQNSNVAALLLGKLDNMRELDIQMTLLPSSALPEHSQYLSTADLVTVVGNLLENAIEAINAQCGDGPRNIDLQISEDDSSLLLMVSDTGVGIPSESLERIYESGFSTKATSGRGVGMSLIREIITARHGSIEVESEPGIGTTFTIIFSEKRQRR